MEEEIWKDIEGFEGLYQVSNLGRVKSMARVVACNGGYRIAKEKLLKAGKNNWGYMQVILSMDGKSKHWLVHRLVWEAFNGTIPHGLQVNHVDEDKTNNKLENLNLMTPTQNINYGTRTTRARLSRNRNRKKDVAQH